MTDIEAAKILIRLLDLTSLNRDDTKETIKDLCNRANTPYGSTAAVCVYPEFIATALHEIKNNIKIATVVNFPDGNSDTKQLEKEIKQAIKLGADEIDAVLPYKELLAGNDDVCTKFLTKARKLCGDKTLKIIIESGELKSTNNIKKATRMAIEAGADFVKTSTGKTAISATPEAANAILEEIKASGKDVGFKASGGIKTLEDAKKYLSLAISIMDPNWINTKHFRIGASSVLNNLLERINKGY
ncbi:MAG: deoxyribose-phosphate aldolase [Alphaproteobacteria bacterium]|nr:deoxyribose-phosphate aldolase [Alphaproteobacteria bacterium]MBQ7285490.1 deoxyribose-phosphate aldolase [Alphaproteobacteria bacterium]